MEEVYKIYGDIWKIHKEFFDIKQNEDNRWEELDKQINELYKKYKKHPLVKSLSYSMLQELQRTSVA